jgi:hypothetical protein
MKIRKVHNITTERIEIPYHSLIVPSFVHSYSVCVEVIKKWFLSKFKEDFFTSVQMEGANIMDQLRRYDKTTILQRKSPALYITPSIDMSYNRDNLYLYQYGSNLSVYNGLLDRAFFKDNKHNTFISVSCEEMSVSVNFKIKVSTKAKQLDLYRYLQLACRAGATETLGFDMDMHIPYNLIMQLASDVGFTIDPETEKIDSIIPFINYLNQNSLLPFLYKYRCINGKNEFFVRLPDSNMHLNIAGDINIDDGTRVDQMTKDFGLELSVNANMMAPKFYVYHSRNEHLIIERGGYIEGNDTAYVFNSIKLPDIDTVDEHGWNQYLQTEFEEDEITNPLVIDLKDLFRGSDLEEIIRYTIDIGVSPAVFLNFRIYNDGIRKKIDVDYRNLILYVQEPVTSYITNIFIYANLQYINDQLITAKEMYKGRVN